VGIPHKKLLLFPAKWIILGLTNFLAKINRFPLLALSIRVQGMVMTMLDQLIQAALEEKAQQRKFPPERADPPIIAWLKQSDGGRCENGSGP
jgi:hypothetical protein